MNTIYIDPSIDMNTNKDVTVIIHFKTQPAKSAVALAKSAGNSLTLEQAQQEVETSHLRFQNDLRRLLGQKRIPYKVNFTYKSAINGVSLTLPGNKIRELLHSPEIASIYANKQYSIDPPYQEY